VLARISGEVGTLYTVLLSVDSGTRLPIFIQICSYLADMEQEISWHFLLRHCMYISNKYAQKCMISYVKYPNFPSGKTSDPW